MKGYLVAVAVVVTAIGVKTVVSSLGADHPFLLFPAAVILATWYGGRRPGLLATTLASISADVLFVPPIGFGATSPSDLVALVVLFAEGLLIVLVTDSLREARLRAADQGLQADRAHRATSFSLSVRDEVLGLWTQKLTGPLAHVAAAARRTHQALDAGDREAALEALAGLEADISLLQRTAERAVPRQYQVAPVE